MKFIVQVVAVFFALKTRKVKIKAINDAKWIAIIIYVTSACLVILLATSFLLSSFLNADAGAFSAGLIILSYIVLLILFIPKVRDHYYTHTCIKLSNYRPVARI